MSSYSYEGEPSPCSLRTDSQLSPVALIKIGREKTIHAFDEVATRLFGYAREEIAGERLDVIFPEWCAFASQQWGTREGIRMLSTTARRKGGCSFPATVVLLTVDSVEEGTAWLAVFETGDQLGESKTLREAGSPCHIGVEERGQLVCRSLADGTLISVNDAYCRYFNKTREELIGQSYVSLIPEADQEPVKRYLHSFNRENPLTIIEHRVIAPNGEIRWQQWADFAVFDETGHLTEVLSVGYDITERKWAEEQMKQQRHELAALNAIIGAVGHALGLSEVLQALREQLQRFYNVPGGVIFIYEYDPERLRTALSWGIPEDVLTNLNGPSLDDFYHPQALEAKAPLFMPDFRSFTPLALSGLAKNRPRWQAYVSIPLLANDEIQGILDLFSPSADLIQENQRAFFETLGREIGIAIANARLYEEVLAGRSRLQMLSRQLVEVQEAERGRIARELHDQIGGLLTGLALTLEMHSRTTAEESLAYLEEARTLVNDLMERVRNLSLDLRPAILDDLGLLPALVWFCRRYTEQTGVRCELEHSGLEERFDSEVETAAYRIVQEALTNVARHADVQAATVRVRSDRRQLIVQIEDEGKGFLPEVALASNNTFGLTSMRERAALVGGQVTIESAPGAGTLVVAVLPFNTSEDDRRERS